jgi:hypothetical protein
MTRITYMPCDDTDHLSIYIRRQAKAWMGGAAGAAGGGAGGAGGARETGADTRGALETGAPWHA